MGGTVPSRRYRGRGDSPSPFGATLPVRLCDAIGGLFSVALSVALGHPTCVWRLITPSR